MSFGFSVGDFIAVGKLAGAVYKKCKDAKGAPESFSKVASEVASLQAVLQDAQDVLFARPLKPERQVRIKTVANGCTETLQDLEMYIDKYKSLGTEDKRIRDRWKYANNDGSELRSRLISNVGMLNLLVNTSQLIVEHKLTSFVERLDPNAREGSILSFHTAVSALGEDDIASRIFDMDHGESYDAPSVSEASQDQASTGPLAHETADDGLNPDTRADDETVEADANTREGSIMSDVTTNSLTPDEMIAWRDVRKDLAGVGITVAAFETNREFILDWFASAMESGDLNLQSEPTSNGLSTPADQKLPASKAHSVRPASQLSPPVARLLRIYDTISPSRQRLFQALRSRQYDQILEYLNRQASISQELLDRTLSETVRRHDLSGLVVTVIETLLIKGANPNFIELTENRFTSLMWAIDKESEEVVKMLLVRGADPNYISVTMDIMKSTKYLPIISHAFDRSEGIFSLLISYGMDLNIKFRPWSFDPGWTTPLHEAARFNENLRRLLEAGAEINNIDQFNHETPLMVALIYSDISAARLLIEKGADISIIVTKQEAERWGKFRNAIETAVFSKQKQKLQLLFDSGQRQGWLQALDEREDILGGLPFSIRTYIPKQNDDRDEIEDGYKSLLQWARGIPYSDTDSEPDIF